MDTDRQLHALKLLIENDGLEGWQITDHAKSLLRQLINAWSARNTQLSAPSPDALPEIESGEANATAKVGDQPGLHDGNAGSQETKAGGNNDFPGDRDPSGKPSTGGAGPASS